MNILIPIAGEDKFFSREEYFFPKPLIEIEAQRALGPAIDVKLTM